MKDISEKTYHLAGLAINVASAGDGRPVIFLHNGGGFWQSWLHQIKYFRRFFKVYAIDWPGCGKSEYPGYPLNQSLTVRVLKEFIELNNMARVILIGNCIGASAALEYGLGQEKKVEQLIMMNICPGNELIPRIFNKKKIANLKTNSRAFKFRYKMLQVLVPGIITRFYFPKILFGSGVSNDDYLFKQYRIKQKEKNQIRSRFDLMFAAHTYNLENIINHQFAPKHLLIWGEENKVVDFERFGKDYRSKLRSEDFYIIKGAGHLCAYEKPEIVNPLIESHLLKKNDY
jgi:pimeloyl-ACP methyl ester carboxylesterase